MKAFFLLLLLPLAAVAFEPTAPVTQESYESMIDRAQNFYGPHVALSGKSLLIKKSWNDPAATCFADFERPPLYHITLSGGAFRNRTMTNDGLAYTICHEVNHIIGGDPKYSPGYWPSIEGQADYMATNTCLRVMFAEDDNRSVIARMKIPAEVKVACEKVYADSEESALCQRSAMAGYIFAESYRQFKLKPGEYQRIYPPISFTKKDPTVVRETNRSYSSPQCRFDTALAGALCVKGKNFMLDQFKDPNAFVCANRPKCWLKE